MSSLWLSWRFRHWQPVKLYSSRWTAAFGPLSVWRRPRRPSFLFERCTHWFDCRAFGRKLGLQAIAGRRPTRDSLDWCCECADLAAGWLLLRQSAFNCLPDSWLESGCSVFSCESLGQSRSCAEWPAEILAGATIAEWESRYQLHGRLEDFFSFARAPLCLAEVNSAGSTRCSLVSSGRNSPHCTYSYILTTVLGLCVMSQAC